MSAPITQISAEEVDQLRAGGLLTLPGPVRPYELEVSHVWPDQYRYNGHWVHGRVKDGTWRTLRVGVAQPQ